MAELYIERDVDTSEAMCIRESGSCGGRGIVDRGHATDVVIADSVGKSETLSMI